MRGGIGVLIQVLKQDRIIVQKCNIANTFFKRLKGLLGKKDFPENEGLYIPKCNSIHMFFMKFPIDVLFLDQNKQIVFLLEDFSPWKIKSPVKKAIATLELPSGTIKKHSLKVGDNIDFIETPV
jgi:uncharacterized membrane protein (UPF0127 family)